MINSIQNCLLKKRIDISLSQNKNKQNSGQKKRLHLKRLVRESILLRAEFFLQVKPINVMGMLPIDDQTLITKAKTKQFELKSGVCSTH